MQMLKSVNPMSEIHPELKDIQIAAGSLDEDAIG